jgi:hypothetical protein
MKILQILVLILIVSLSVSLVIGQEKVVSSVSLSGIVRIEGKPVKEVQIQLTDEKGLKYSTITNEKGKYKLNVPIGKYRIYAVETLNKCNFVGCAGEFSKEDFWITKKRKIKFDISLYFGEG